MTFNKLHPFDTRPAQAHLYVFELEWFVEDRTCHAVSLGWGYRMEEVMAEIHAEEIRKRNDKEIGIKPICVIPLSEILDRIDVDGLLGMLATRKGMPMPKFAPAASPERPKRVERPTIGVSNFIWGLKLCRDRYARLFTKSEKAALARMVKKVEKQLSKPSPIISANIATNEPDKVQRTL